MAGPVAGVGIGLFILAFVWILALTICLAFSRSPTKTGSLGPLAIVAALVISLILILIPREAQMASEAEQAVVYDYSIVYRSSLIAVMALFILVGLALYLVQHGMAAIQAKPLRQFLR